MIRRHASALHLALGLADAGSAVVLFVAVSSTCGSARSGTSPGPWPASTARRRARLRGRLVVCPLDPRPVPPASPVAAVARSPGHRVGDGRAGARNAVGSLPVEDLEDVSRLFLFVLFPVQIMVTAGTRLTIRLVFSRTRSHGRNLRYLLMVGANDASYAFADRIVAHRELGLEVIGYLAAPARRARPREPGRSSAGSAQIEQVLHGQVVDEVAICLPPSGWALVDPVAQICHDEGRIVRIPLLDLGFSVTVGRIEDFEGVPILSVVRGPDRTIGLAIKRALDLAGAVVASLRTEPGAADRRDPHPRQGGATRAIFTQTRVGSHGRLFRIRKFRTMVPDAEARYADVVDRSDPRAFKLTDDPRVTRSAPSCAGPASTSCPSSGTSSAVR